MSHDPAGSHDPDRELFPPLFDSVCRMFRQKKDTFTILLIGLPPEQAAQDLSLRTVTETHHIVHDKHGHTGLATVPLGACTRVCDIPVLVIVTL